MAFTFLEQERLHVLHRRTRADPVPVAPERAPPAIDVVVLLERCKALLVRVKVQPPIQDPGRIRGLNQPAANQGPVDEVLCGDDPRSRRLRRVC